MRGHLILPLLGLLALGCAAKCPEQRQSPGREIFCYTSTFDIKQLEDSICRCTTLVHQGHDLQDLTTTGLADLHKSLVQLNPVLQFVISINDARGRLMTSADARQESVARIARILNQVDGVELNVTAGTKERLVHFVQGLKNEIIRKSLKKRIILALPTKSEQLAKQFDIKELSKFVDLFTIPTHYLTDDEENYKTFHPSRLMGLFDLLNTDSLVDLVHGLGATKRKILVSLPASGYKFTLKIKDLNTPRAPTQQINPVSINRIQLCQAISQDEWTIERDEDLTAPYAFTNNTWIAFEDKISAKIKGKYILLRDLAGLAIRDIENDLKNDCGNTITEDVYNSITDNRRKTREAVLTSLENDIYSTETLYPKNLKSSDFRISRIVDSQGKIKAVRENIQTEFSCPRQGYFVHPHSCNRFYRCVKFNQQVENYSVFEFDCPAGLAFDESTDVCVWPGSLSKSSPCPGSPEIAPSTPRRFSCPKEGYYADPENCQWFFACMDLGGDKMLAYEFQCPYGLVFDENKLACEWPWLVPKCAGTNYENKGFGSGVIGGGYGGHNQGGYGGSGQPGYDYDGNQGNYGGHGSNEGGYDESSQGGGGYYYGGHDNSGYGGSGHPGYDGSSGGDGSHGHGGYGAKGNGNDGGYDGSSEGGHGGSGPGHESHGDDGSYEGKGMDYDYDYGGKGHGNQGGHGGTEQSGHDESHGEDGSYDGQGMDHDNGGKGHGNKDGHGVSKPSGYDNSNGEDGSYGGKGMDYDNGGKGHGNQDGHGVSKPSGYDNSNGEDGSYGGKGMDYDYGGKDQGNQDGHGVSKPSGYDDSNGEDGSYGGKGTDYDYGGKDQGNQDGHGVSKPSGYDNSNGEDGSYGGKGMDYDYGGKDQGNQDGHGGLRPSGHDESHGNDGSYEGQGMDHSYDGKDQGNQGGYDESSHGGHDGTEQSEHDEPQGEDGYEGKGMDHGYDGNRGKDEGNQGSYDESSQGGYDTHESKNPEDDGSYHEPSPENDGGYGSRTTSVNYGMKDQENQGGDQGYTTISAHSSSKAGYPSVLHSGYTPSAGGGIPTILVGGYSTGGFEHSTLISGSQKPQLTSSGYTYPQPGTKEYTINQGYDVSTGSLSTPQGPIYRGDAGKFTKATHTSEAITTDVYKKGIITTGSSQTGYSKSDYGTTSGLFTAGKTFPGVLDNGNTLISHRPTSFGNEFYPNQARESFTPSVTFKNQGTFTSAGSSLTTGNQFYTNEAAIYNTGAGSPGQTFTPSFRPIASTGSGYYTSGSGSKERTFTPSFTSTGNEYYNGAAGSKGQTFKPAFTSFTSTGNEYYTNKASDSYNGNGNSNIPSGYTPSITSIATENEYYNNNNNDINNKFATTDFRKTTFTPSIATGYPGNPYYTNQPGYNKNISTSRGTLFTSEMSVTSAGNQFFPNQAANPTSTNLEIPITTADDGTGYKTNEYHDNGGRGTIRYNNGLVTHKYTEDDIRLHHTSFTINPTPDSAQTNPVTLSSGGVYTRGGFTKIGPTKTGITTAQVGGTGSYVAAELDNRPTSKPDQIGANAFGTVTQSPEEENSQSYSTGEKNTVDSSKTKSEQDSNIVTSGYSYDKPTVQLNTISTKSQSASYQGQDNSIPTLTPFLNVDVYNNPSVATSSPAVVNTYSYAKSTGPQYQENMYQYDKTSTAASAGEYSESLSKTTQRKYPAVGYTTGPLDDYQSTLFEAARIPTVPRVRPVIDTGFKTVISPTAASVTVATAHQNNFDNQNIMTNSVNGNDDSSLNVRVSFGQTSGQQENNYNNEVTKTGDEFAGYTYDRTDSDFEGRFYNKESTTEAVAYQRTAANPEDLKKPTFIISYTESSKFDENKDSYDTSDVSYSKPPIEFVSSEAPTLEPTEYPSTSSNPMITRDQIKKLVSNYNRGTVKYAPADYDEIRYSSGLSGTQPSVPEYETNTDDESNKYELSEDGSPTESNRYQSTNFPSIRKSSLSSVSKSVGILSKNTYTTNQPSVTTYSGNYRKSLTTQTSELISRSSEVAQTKTAMGKVIVKFSDLHPLLLGKLSAECTCRADPFAIRGNKPLLIDSSNGKVDLSNYDESDIYVELEKSKESSLDNYDDSITVYGSSTKSPLNKISSRVTPVVAQFNGVTKSAKLRRPSSTYLPAYRTSSSSSPSTRRPPSSSNQQSTTSSSLRVSASDIEYSTRARSRSGKSIGTFRSTNSPDQVTESIASPAADDRIDYGEVGVLELNPEGKAECARPGLFRHPKYCNKFYACHWDSWKKKFTLHIFNCPIHLTFDNKAAACNWPTKGPACQDNNLLI
ncbi:uncharacterized protein LOC103571413 [Microplitis demolitor]|uniref:uncharacterized protein LOC103571413 n=1 Tax=Microplitis demolitor TaxID=69319 RepID=UPI00235B6366|nr:uncharacterized protein LOC103571413 [Microplitis demolitor]XP_014295435.2 uncharacterized protein LOC103571413 [Microplitis demolitor]